MKPASPARPWLRRLTLFGGAGVGLLCGAALATPALLRGPVRARLDRELAARVDADVSIGDFDLALIPAFPNLTLELSDLRVTGKGDFEGVELLQVKEAAFSVDLASLASGGTVELRELRLVEPVIHVRVNTDGRSNTDIMKPQPTPPGEAAPPAPLRARLKRAVVRDLSLTYDDAPGRVSVIAADLDHEGSGSISGDRLRYRAETGVGALTVRQGGVGLLDAARVALDLDVALDLATGAAAFGSSRLQVNSLPLRFEGEVEPVREGTRLDMSFTAEESSFREILSLIPSVYKGDIARLEASGSLAVSGKVNGILPEQGDSLPALSLRAKVEDGRFRDPSLPVGVDDVALEVLVDHPGGPPDALVLDVPRFHFSVDGRPVDGRLRLKHITTDPLVEAAVQADLDLGRLRAALPPDDSTFSGALKLDLDVLGRVSQLESASLDGVRARGSVELKDARYMGPDVAEELQVARLSMEMDTASVQVKALEMRFGSSDLSGQGRLENVIGYALGKGALAGELTAKSKRLDLRPWSGPDEPATSGGGKGKEPAAEEAGVATVPTDLAVRVKAEAGRVLYDTYDLTDFHGDIEVKDGVADVRDFRARAFGGQVSMKGRYAAPTERQADVDMVLGISGFGLSDLLAASDTLQRIAPIAKGAPGKVSASFRVKTRLRRDMSPDLSTLYSQGDLSAVNLRLSPAFLKKVSDVMKDKSFGSIVLDNHKLGFEIEQGKVHISPTMLLLAGAAATLAGSTGVLDESLDLDLKTDVPLPKAKASGLLQEAGVAKGGKVPLRIQVGGTFDKPTVKTNLGDLAAEVVDAGVDKAVEAAKKAGDKLIDEAEVAGDALISEAKKAGDKLREEAKKGSDRLVKEAGKNPVAVAAAKEAGKKLKKEADEKAGKLVKAAEKKKDELVEKARDKKDQLIEAAGKGAKAKAKGG